MKSSPRILSAILLLGLASPARSHAAPPGPDERRSQVNKLLDQADAALCVDRDVRKPGPPCTVDRQAAYEAYRTAWGLQKSHDLAGNLGSLALKLGKHREAAAHLSYAVENFPPTGDPAKLSALREKQATALREVGRVRVRVSVDGASLVVNGQPAGTSPVGSTMYLDAGTVTVAATLAGYVSAQRTVTVEKGGDQEVVLSLVPEPRRSRVPVIVLGSVAGVALATGIGVFAAGRAKGSSYMDLHDAILEARHSCVAGAANHDPACGEALSRATSANTLQKVGVGLLIGAGAAAAGAVIYFALPPSRAGGGRGNRSPLTAALSPAAGGLVVSGTF